MARKGRPDAQAELAALQNSGAREEAMSQARKQVSTVYRVGAIATVVTWLLAAGFASGLETTIPWYGAAVFTVAVVVLLLLVRRNFGRSEALGALMGGDLDDEERNRRIEKLADRVEKGEHAAILAKAQLQMNQDPKAALHTLEGANLEKGQKIVRNQILGMRTMLHLNLGEVKAARDLAERIELQKTPDIPTRANLAGVVAEAWARTGNPIEAHELLDQYDPSEKSLKDVKVQLWRAQAFVGAHRNDVGKMKKALKELETVSAQLLAAFVSGKRVHPLLAKEARKRLEKSGMAPRPKVKMLTR